MGLYKDVYAETLENMIEDFLEKNPGVTWEDAYEMLSESAYDAAMDKVADMNDYYSDKVKGH